MIQLLPSSSVSRKSESFVQLLFVAAPAPCLLSSPTRWPILSWTLRSLCWLLRLNQTCKRCLTMIDDGKNFSRKGPTLCPVSVCSF